MTSPDYLPAQLRPLSDIENFTEAIIWVQRNNSFTTRQKGRMIAEALEQSLQRLQGRGQLTPAVQAELVRLAEISLRSLSDVSGSYGRSLRLLIQQYENRPALPAGDQRFANHAPLTWRE